MASSPHNPGDRGPGDVRRLRNLFRAAIAENHVKTQSGNGESETKLSNVELLKRAFVKRSKEPVQTPATDTIQDQEEEAADLIPTDTPYTEQERVQAQAAGAANDKPGSREEPRASGSRPLICRRLSFVSKIASGVQSLKAFNLTLDGRVRITYQDKEYETVLDAIHEEEEGHDEAETLDIALREESRSWRPPKLTIVMLIVGTRGDVQPFLALGRAMKEYGHRVRLATHATFRDWVISNGLEFYPLGGDPKVLSEYIARNRGIVPYGGWADITAQRGQLSEIIDSTYAACTEPDEEGHMTPFRAECIVANPPSLGHIHCAERLGVPLHIFFTMPWSPTSSFPHPLALIANRTSIQKHTRALNKLSYYTTDAIIWAGNADLVNKFRKKIGLKPIRLMHHGAQMLTMLKVPHTYCWSPALVQKPQDWKDHIDVVGFFFLDESKHTQYQPPDDLREFMEAGPPPIYVGVGSLVVDNPVGFTKIIYEAARKTTSRIILSKGWANLGEGVDNKPGNVLLLGNCPHDWLFPRCSAVVHHGGAGTTAAGLRAACPTTIVPFFGDQPFWGEACCRAGVGPAAIPIDLLTVDKMVAAIRFMQRPEVKDAVSVLATRMSEEDGLEQGLASFHKQLCRHREHFLDTAKTPVDWSIKMKMPPVPGPPAIIKDATKLLKEDVQYLGNGIGEASNYMTASLSSVVAHAVSGLGLVCPCTVSRKVVPSH
mmetsp:Transcript_1883/g.5490  ORF Transcript_1883/g.5490 Transcript_1883/m.5490 type:complete len:715 (+) Transcript_1883:126-2270(+)